jgi:hypothetical protein
MFNSIVSLVKNDRVALAEFFANSADVVISHSDDFYVWMLGDIDHFGR